MRASAPSTRRAKAAESFQTAAECIGELAPGMALFALTRGQFSMIDAILACLDQTGPAAVSFWTWTVAEYEVQCVERLMIDGRITAGRMVIDVGSRGKQIPLLRQWHRAFGPDSIRLVRNHAKIATIHNADWRLLLRGSMNLNFNPRFEQFDLTEGGLDFDLIAQVEADLPVLPLTCSINEARNATKLSTAWSEDQLGLFEGARTWQP